MAAAQRVGPDAVPDEAVRPQATDAGVLWPRHHETIKPRATPSLSQRPGRIFLAGRYPLAAPAHPTIGRPAERPASVIYGGGPFLDGPIIANPLAPMDPGAQRPGRLTRSRHQSLCHASNR
jgi:hypothetical protein